MKLSERLSKAVQVIFNRDIDSRTPKGFSYLFGGFPTSSGKQVSQRSSIGLTAIYHAVDLISGDYGSLPHKVYNYTSNGKDLIQDHNAYRLLNIEPNYYQTPLEYHRMMAVYRLMYGNAYALIDRFEGSSQIRNLIPVHPERVIEITEYQNELFYEIKGIDGLVSQYNMIHVRDLSLDTNYKGKARIDACAEAVGSGLALQDYTASFFGNGANVGMVLESEQGALEDEDQRNAIKNSLQEYQGSENSHKPLVLPWGIRISHGPTKFNQQQTQFIETKIHFVEEVAQIFNLPLHKMRIDSDGNSYNSVEQANIEYLTDCLSPFSKAFEQEYNRKIFPSIERGEFFVKVDMDDKQMADLNTKADYVIKLVQNGIYSTNDALRELNKNTIGEEGDYRYIQSNQMKLGSDPIENKQDGKEDN